MDGLSLPISFTTLLIALIMAVRIAFGPGHTASARLCFAALFSVMALQAGLVGLRFSYGYDFLAPLQRVLPFAIGPLLYLGFRLLANSSIHTREILLAHALPALAATLAFSLFAPLFDYVDLAITGSYITYILLMLRLYLRAPDGFRDVVFENAGALRRWLLAATLFLGGIAVTDGVIALDFLIFAGQHASRIIFVCSFAVIGVFIAALALYPRSPAKATASPRKAPAAGQDNEEDSALLAALYDLLEEKQFYRDPDLTLTRLAKRLGVPARNVSAAVNRLHGMNISQFVNRYRIEQAAHQLRHGEVPVYEIMEAVGFRTKSNFNREFRRIMGCSPLEHRQRRDGQ